MDQNQQPSYSNLSNGSSGEDVRKLQQTLMDAGYDVGSTGADGIYGKRTQEAVTKYQQDKGLVVDGIAGKQTQSSLYEAASQPSQSQPAQQGTQQKAQPTSQQTQQPSSSTAAQQGASAAPDWEKPYQTVYTDPTGAQKVGYIYQGVTYADASLTAQVPVGSVVTDAYGRTWTKKADQSADVSASRPGASVVSADPVIADLRSALDQWKASAEAQQQLAVDFNVRKQVEELERALEDAQPTFQNNLSQIDNDEQIAKSNQAYYAEARGDKGGIGAAQYDAVMNTAAINRQAVKTAQTKLSTDTWRQINDLRAQGEFEKADKMFQIAQAYLSSLMDLEQWAANYGLSVAQFEQAVAKWQAEYDVEIAQLAAKGIYVSGQAGSQPTVSGGTLVGKWDVQPDAGVAAKGYDAGSPIGNMVNDYLNKVRDGQMTKTQAAAMMRDKSVYSKYGLASAPAESTIENVFAEADSTRNKNMQYLESKYRVHSNDAELTEADALEEIGKDKAKYGLSSSEVLRLVDIFNGKTTVTREGSGSR